jgi:hypothetical protein
MYAELAAASLIGNVLYLVLAPLLAIVAASIVLIAVFLEPTNPIWMTILQERVREAMRGRLFGSLTARSSGARSLGILVERAMLQRLGLRETLIALATMNVAVPLMLWIAPPLRALGHRQSRWANAEAATAA